MERVKQLTPIQMRSEGSKPLWQWDCIRYVFERINGKYSPPLTHTAPYTPLHLPSTPNRTPHNRAYSRPPADLDDHTLTPRHALVTSVPVQRHLKNKETRRGQRQRCEGGAYILTGNWKRRNEEMNMQTKTSTKAKTNKRTGANLSIARARLRHVPICHAQTPSMRATNADVP